MSRVPVQPEASGSQRNLPLLPAEQGRGATSRRRVLRRDRAWGVSQRKPKAPGRNARSAGSAFSGTDPHANGASSSGAGCASGRPASQRPQKVEALGRCWPCSMPMNVRRQHGAHRTRIDPAVSVAAGGQIDRAVVHAGAAADAAEHVLKAGAEHGGAGRCPEARCGRLPARPGRPCAWGRSGAWCRLEKSWPVPERASRRSIKKASSSVGATFSMPVTAMWVFGRPWVKLGIALIGHQHDRAGLGDQGNLRR